MAPVAGLAMEDQSVDEEFWFKRMNKALWRVLFDVEDLGRGSVPLHLILRFAKEFPLSRQKSECSACGNSRGGGRSPPSEVASISLPRRFRSGVEGFDARCAVGFGATVGRALMPFIGD